MKIPFSSSVLLACLLGGQPPVVISGGDADAPSATATRSLRVIGGTFLLNLVLLPYPLLL